MPSGIYRSGDYRIDLPRRELGRNGTPLAASPKVFDCIAYLVEHRERAVGRDELIAAVWGRTDITYPALAQLVIKARRTLGGSGDDQHVIRTLPRFGYRWVAETCSEAIIDLPVHATASAPRSAARFSMTARTGWMLPALLLAGIAVAIAISTVPGVSRLRSDASADRAGAPARTTEAIAVLPLDVQADGPWSWVRLGVMDLIAESLRDAGVPVVPSENVVALARDPGTAADAVRDATGVGRVVVARASLSEKGWSVRLALTSVRGVEHVVEASAGDVTAAAQSATHRLLAALGRQIPVQPAEATAHSLAELLARARSALFDNDLESARHILESAPEELRRSPEMRRRLAQAHYRAGKLEAASDGLEKLLGELGAESDQRRRATVLNDLGVVAIYADRPELAEHRFDESLALLARQNDPVELGRAHLGRGIAYSLGGDYDRAAPEFARARVAYGISGDALALATVEADEAELEIRYDRYATAKPMLERAAERFEPLGARHELFSTLASRIHVELALLDPVQAYAIGAHWVVRLGELQSPRIRKVFLLEWARALAATGRLAEARKVLDTLPRRNRDASEYPPGVSIEHARLDFADGRLASALAASTGAVDALTLPDYAGMRALAWLTAIRVRLALGRTDEAASETRKFLVWANANANDVTAVKLYATLAEAESADREGRRDASRQAGESALRTALRSGVPAYVAEAAESYGTLLLSWTDFDHAATVIGSVARYAAKDFRCALLVARLHHALGRHEDWMIALGQTQALAGERQIPPEVASPPRPVEAPRVAGIPPANP